MTIETTTPAPVKRRRWPALLAAAASLSILALSVFVVSRTLAGLDWAALGAAMRATSTGQFALAGAFAAGSYLALTGYDWIALRHLGERAPYRTVALASFTASSLSMTLGFPLATGGAVRYWIYSRAGVPAARVAAIILLVSLTYWTGVAGVVGLGLLLRPEDLAEVDRLTPAANMAIGAGLIAALVIWLAWVSARPRRLTIGGLVIATPRARLAFAQVGVAMADVSCAAGALWALMPAGHGLDFAGFAPTFVAAQVLGVASNVPGGVGPFEAAMLNAIDHLSAETVFASLLLFRAVYFLIPFVLGLAALGAHEAWTRWAQTADPALDRPSPDALRGQPEKPAAAP